MARIDTKSADGLLQSAPAHAAANDAPSPPLGESAPQRRWACLGKRGFDVVFSLLLVVVLSPVGVVVALAVLIEGGRPIIYRQERIGRGGRPFSIFKFRSMAPELNEGERRHVARLADGELNIGQAVRLLKPVGDPRVTRLGWFLRVTSLDELPQLINVLRGDMSLVGPRPLRAFEVERLSGWQLVRQQVRPGMTGLWQVLGRSAVDWDDRMRLDYLYVRHWSPMGDLKLLLKTIPAVLGREGAQ